MEQNEHEMTLRKEELQFSLHYQYSQEYDLFNNPFREFNRKRKKTYLGYNVLCAAQGRISYVFDNFQRIYVSFSGGKDCGWPRKLDNLTWCKMPVK